MKLALALIAGLALAAPVAAKPAAAAVPKAAHWAEVYAATADGGYRRGNPNAKVKLIEYGSMTCPHCRAFHQEAMTPLIDKYVAAGTLSYEYRSFILNAPDFAAALIARCSGNPKTFFSALNSFYPDQPVWTQPFIDVSEADQKKLNDLPEDKRVPALAVIGKLDVYAAKLGMSRARFDACEADKVQTDKLLAMRKVATETYKVPSTPAFLINGTYQENTYNWAALEPLLQAVLKP